MSDIPCDRRSRHPRRRTTWLLAAAMVAGALGAPAAAPAAGGGLTAGAPGGDQGAGGPASTGADGAAGAAASAGAAGGGGAAAEVDAAATAGAVYVPVTPQRVLDTREGFGGSYLRPQQSQTVTVATPAVLGAAQLTDASTVQGVVINVTATQSAGPGYITVWPAGLAWPGSSNLNLEAAGQTMPNLVTTRVTAGQVQLMASTGVHVVADVQGLYVDAGSTPTAGRLVPVGPVRSYDSREGPGALRPGEERIIDLSAAGVAADATAAVLTITAVDAPSAGHWLVWPADRARPLASNLNPERPGQTVANQVVTGVDGGRLRVWGTTGGHLIVDVAGYVTGSTAASSSDGLFVAMTPVRLGDTRQPGELGSWGGGVRPAPQATVEVRVAGRGGVPASGVAAVALNVTVTEATGPGYITVWAARQPRPGTSNINLERAGQTVPGHVVTPVGAGAVNLFTAGGSHLVTDVTGYWTGPPEPPEPVVDVKPGKQPASPPALGPHSFLYRLDSGQYARWNPCAAVRYAVNDDRARPGQRAMLENVLLEAEAATGLDLVYVGETSEGLDGKPPSGADVVLAFTDAAASPQLRTAVGLGGGTYRSSGVVSGYALFVNSYGTTVYQQDLMLHEVGHMLGISHVADETQVMNPYLVPLARYSNGDLEGLWRMGAAQGCTLAAAALSLDGRSPDPLLEASGEDDHGGPSWAAGSDSSH